jgi:hypothetical protein
MRHRVSLEPAGERTVQQTPHDTPFGTIRLMQVSNIFRYSLEIILGNENDLSNWSRSFHAESPEPERESDVIQVGCTCQLQR